MHTKQGSKWRGNTHKQIYFWAIYFFCSLISELFLRFSLGDLSMKPWMHSLMVYFSATDFYYFNNLLVIKKAFVNTLSFIEEYFMLYKWGETLLPRQHFISTKVPRMQFRMSFSQVVPVYKCNFYLWSKYAFWPASLILQVDIPSKRKVSNVLHVC